MAKQIIKMSCGHEHELHLPGAHKERDRKIVWAATEGLCGECFKAASAKKSEAPVERTMGEKICRLKDMMIERDITEMALIELMGVSIEWAKDPAHRVAFVDLALEKLGL